MIDENKFERVWHLKTEPKDATYAAALVKLKNGDKYALVNQEGDVLVDFDDVETVGNYGGFVKEGEKWGYVDRQGKWVITPRYDRTWYLSYPDNDRKALALVGIDENLALINRQGEIIIEFDDTSKFDCHQGGYVEKDGKWGFIDTYGNWKIPPQLDEEPEFYRGIAWLKSDGKHVFVKENGEFVTPLKFDEAIYFQYYTYYGDPKGTGIAIARIADYWGFLDEQGHWIMEPQFDDIEVTTEVVDGPRPWVKINDGYGSLHKNEDGFYIKWESEPSALLTRSQIEENLRKKVLKECTLAGIHKYMPEDSERWDRIGKGTEIVLLREKDNKFDPNAVAVALAEEFSQDSENFDFKNIIGYIPKKENLEISKALDAGETGIKAKIISVNEYGPNPNERIWVRVWATGNNDSDKNKI